jgi:hypothetical protein
MSRFYYPIQMSAQEREQRIRELVGWIHDYKHERGPYCRRSMQVDPNLLPEPRQQQLQAIFVQPQQLPQRKESWLQMLWKHSVY